MSECRYREHECDYSTYEREGTGEVIEKHAWEDRIVEQSENDLLILEPLPEPFHRYDRGKRRKVRFTHNLICRWLSDPDDWTHVKGSEVAYITRMEADRARESGIFNCFRLFP